MHPFWIKVLFIYLYLSWPQILNGNLVIYLEKNYQFLFVLLLFILFIWKETMHKFNINVTLDTTKPVLSVSFFFIEMNT